MLLATETITISVPFPDNGGVGRKSYTVKGVSWFEKYDGTDKGGLDKAGKSVIIRIPVSHMDLPFMDYPEWLSNKETAWTVTKDAKINQGSNSAYNGGLTVVSYSKNVRGMEPHIKVVCQ